MQLFLNVFENLAQLYYITAPGYKINIFKIIFVSLIVASFLKAKINLLRNYRLLLLGTQALLKVQIWNALGIWNVLGI